MITCLGLVVGVVQSAIRQDVLNQCAEFLKTHRYLNGTNIEFEIDREVYATAIDTCEYPDGRFGVLFTMYNGQTTIGVA
jgi:hypothetical protein